MSHLADLAMILLTMGMLALLGIGVAQSARRGGRDAASSKTLALMIVGALTVWLAFTAALATSGVLAVWTSRPPRWPFVPLTALVAVLAFARTSFARGLINHAPPTWAIGAQTFRVGVELAIFALHEAGRAPVQVTFEGRNYDILVGLSAPLVAWLVFRKRVSPAIIVLWNVLALAILANTVATIATSTPGPLHRDWPGQPFVAIATWPVIWLPAFLAPLAVFFHAVSLRQGLDAARSRRNVPLA
jgi:hypothetical protein